MIIRIDENSNSVLKLYAINYSRNRYATSSRTTRIAINARLEWPSPFPNSAENQFLFTIASISKDSCTLRYINWQNEIRLRINWCILKIIIDSMKINSFIHGTSFLIKSDNFKFCIWYLFEFLLSLKSKRIKF